MGKSSFSEEVVRGFNVNAKGVIRLIVTI